MALLSLCAIYAYVRGCSLHLYLLGALLFLMRIDGLLLLGLLAIAMGVEQKRVPWAHLAVAAAVAAPWLLFATIYFGSPIPVSFLAKVTVYGRGLTLRPVNLEAFRVQFVSGWMQRALTILFLAGSIVVVRSKRCLAPALLWLLIYYAVMLTSHVPAFPWYFLPPWPMFLGVAALGGDGIVRAVVKPDALRKVSAPAGAAALALVGAAGLAHVPAVERDIAQTQHVEDSLRIPIGLWLRGHAARQESILLEPIGYVGYYSHRRILDMIGLVSPEVISCYKSRRPLAAILERFHPDWLCLRPAEVRVLGKEREPLPGSMYRYVREFHVPGRPPDFLIYHRIRRRAIGIPSRSGRQAL
ncbi:MAG TPA: hypothetical protein VGS41_19335, partial [Chthonomonadales bacterium]|nr:hypothetical protein [Chthonomonadales bacterium]